MTDNRRPPRSDRPPTPQSGPHEQLPIPLPVEHHREWTWPAVTVTCVLGLGALVFAWALISSGADPRTTIAVTLALLTGIVAVVASAMTGSSRMRRLLNAVRVLLGDSDTRQ